MAAPLFEQTEIDEIIACEKYAPPVELKKQPRFKASYGCEQRRLRLNVLSDLPWTLELHVDETINKKRRDLSLALLANIERRGREVVCHYDMHMLAHENPDWGGGTRFKPHQFHKHVYRPQNIEHGDLAGLRIATPIKIKCADIFKHKCENLFRVFCSELNIAVDRDNQMKLFE